MSNGESGHADRSASVDAESRSRVETDGEENRYASGGEFLDDSEHPQSNLEYRSSELVQAIESVSAGRQLIYLSTIRETGQVRQRFSRQLSVIDATPQFESMVEFDPTECHLPELEELLETLTRKVDEDEEPVVIIDSLTVLSVYHSPDTVREFVEAVEATLEHVGGRFVPLIGEECHDDGEVELLPEVNIEVLEVSY